MTRDQRLVTLRIHFGWSFLSAIAAVVGI